MTEKWIVRVTSDELPWVNENVLDGIVFRGPKEDVRAAVLKFITGNQSVVDVTRIIE